MPLSRAARAVIREHEAEQAAEQVPAPTPEQVITRRREAVRAALHGADAMTRWRVGDDVDRLVRAALLLAATRRQQAGRVGVSGAFGAASRATRAAFVEVLAAAQVVADDLANLTTNTTQEEA